MRHLKKIFEIKLNNLAEQIKELNITSYFEYLYVVWYETPTSICEYFPNDLSILNIWTKDDLYNKFINDFNQWYNDKLSYDSFNSDIKELKQRKAYFDAHKKELLEEYKELSKDYQEE